VVRGIRTSDGGFPRLKRVNLANLGSYADRRIQIEAHVRGYDFALLMTVARQVSRSTGAGMDHFIERRTSASWSMLKDAISHSHQTTQGGLPVR